MTQFIKKHRYELVDQPNNQPEEDSCAMISYGNLNRNKKKKKYSVLGYRIDLYFHDYKLTIEVDELGHSDRNIDHNIQRQKTIEK